MRYEPKFYNWVPVRLRANCGVCIPGLAEMGDTLTSLTFVDILSLVVTHFHWQ